MKRITTEERQKTIIDESINIIHNYGYNALSIRELAQKVKISEPAIYRHFLNKEEIILGILARLQNFNSELIAEINKHSTPKEKIHSFLYFSFKYLEEKPEITSVLFTEEIFIQSEILKNKLLFILYQRKMLLKSILDQAAQENQLIENDINDLINIIFGLVRIIVLEWRLNNFSFSICERCESAIKTIENILFKK